MDSLLDHVVEGRPARRAEVLLVEAHADTPAAPRQLGHGLVGDLPVAWHQRPRVAVRGHDRPPPRRERVLDRLLGHVAEVEDHLLAAHRLEELRPELGEPARRTRAAAVAGRAPGWADDAYPAVGPGAELGGGLYRVRSFHQQ